MGQFENNIRKVVMDFTKSADSRKRDFITFGDRSIKIDFWEADWSHSGAGAAAADRVAAILEDAGIAFARKDQPYGPAKDNGSRMTRDNLPLLTIQIPKGAAAKTQMAELRTVARMFEKHDITPWPYFALR